MTRQSIMMLRRNWAFAIVPHTLLALAAGCGSSEDVPPREGVIGLKPHQMLVVSGLPGTALIDVTEYGSRRAAYRWRFRSPSSNEVLSGNGVVFEKYKKVWDPVLKMTVSKDVGSQVAIRVGPGDNPIEMDWSYGSRSAAWFYYDPENLHVRILPDNLFDAYEFSEYAVEQDEEPDRNMPGELGAN